MILLRGDLLLLVREGGREGAPENDPYGPISSAAWILKAIVWSASS